MKMQHRPGGVLKVLLIIIVVFLLVVAGVVFLVVKNLDKIAHTAITQGVALILDVPVNLDKVDIDLREGSVNLEGLVIDNPRGFEKEEAFSLGRVYVKTDLNSFRDNMPVIDQVIIREPRITLEYGLKGSNFEKLIENASRFSLPESGGKAAAPAKETAQKVETTSKTVSDAKDVAAMNLLVKKFRLEDADVDLAASAFSFKKEYGMKIPPIEMSNVGGSEQTTAEVTRRVLKEILGAILKSKNMPADFASIADNPAAALQARAELEVDKYVDKGKEELDKTIESGKDRLNKELDKVKGQNEILDQAIEQGKGVIDDAVGDGQGQLEDLLDKNSEELKEEAVKSAEEKAKEELEKLKKKYGL